MFSPSHHHSRQTAGKEISSIRQPLLMAHTGAGMILLALAWSLLTASRASGEAVKLVFAWRAQMNCLCQDAGGGGGLGVL